MKFKPQFDLDLSLSEEERDQLSDLAEEWRDSHTRKYHDAYFTAMQKSEDTGEAYERIHAQLPAKEKKVVEEYIDAINEASSHEVDFFYWAGIEDGIRLARYVLGVKPHQE